MKSLKSKIKNIKGITLISLVVTIIILLILAGITISQLGNSGLFDKSKQAKEKYQNAQEKEETELAKYSNEIDNIVGSNRNNCIIESGDNSTETTEATAWYIKYSNGLVYQWGFGNLSSWQAGFQTVDIVLPFSFLSTNYCVICNPNDIVGNWAYVTYSRISSNHKLYPN